MFGFISKKKLIGEMTLKQAFFILRHGSAEGNHKYLEAVKVIEDEYNRQKAEIERLQKAIEVIDVMEEQHKYYLQKAKAEAVKEFSERLKHIIGFDDLIPIDCVMLFPYIDNLVKEFTEGSKR